MLAPTKVLTKLPAKLPTTVPRKCPPRPGWMHVARKPVFLLSAGVISSLPRKACFSAHLHNALKKAKVMKIELHWSNFTRSNSTCSVSHPDMGTLHQQLQRRKVEDKERRADMREDTRQGPLVQHQQWQADLRSLLHPTPCLGRTGRKRCKHLQQSTRMTHVPRHGKREPAAAMLGDKDGFRLLLGGYLSQRM